LPAWKRSRTARSTSTIKPVSRLDPKDRDLAMVFQDYALYPHMNVAKNMSFALRLKSPLPQGGDRQEGQRGRRDAWPDPVSCTASLASSPAVSASAWPWAGLWCATASTFLFDEPLSNLDAKLRGQMRAELALMRQRVQKNMVYVTHDQIEAMTLGR
jgi:multiple sugar transport system ATP-binding protein